MCVFSPLRAHNLNHEQDDENTRQQLLAKMKEAATYVMDGYETQAASSKGHNRQGFDSNGSPSKVLEVIAE